MNTLCLRDDDDSSASAIRRGWSCVLGKAQWLRRHCWPTSRRAALRFPTWPCSLQVLYCIATALHWPVPCTNLPAPVLSSLPSQPPSHYLFILNLCVYNFYFLTQTFNFYCSVGKLKRSEYENLFWVLGGFGYPELNKKWFKNVCMSVVPALESKPNQPIFT